MTNTSKLILLKNSKRSFQSFITRYLDIKILNRTAHMLNVHCTNHIV